jgi:hypothetical protein
LIKSELIIMIRLIKGGIHMNNMRTKVLTANVPSLAGQEEERGRLTLESLADVDAGLVIDHQAVKAWASSLDTDTPLPVPH